jgi:hypothetical protein
MQHYSKLSFFETQLYKNSTLYEHANWRTMNLMSADCKSKVDHSSHRSDCDREDIQVKTFVQHCVHYIQSCGLSKLSRDQKRCV